MLRRMSTMMRSSSPAEASTSAAAAQTREPRQSSERSSENEVSASRAQQLLVTVRMGVESEVVHLYINAAQRADTALEGQGDHITSYTLILQALLSGASTHLRRAISLIQTFAGKMLEGESLEAFKHIAEPKTHTHAQRIAFMKFLNTQQSALTDMGLPPADIQLFGREIVRGKISQLASYLAELTSCILEGLQQHELSTAFSKGRKNKIKGEGNLAKEAVRALATLDKICQFAAEENPADFFTEPLITEIIYSLSARQPNEVEEDHVLRYGIFSLVEKGVLTTTQSKTTTYREKYIDNLVQFLEAHKQEPKEVYEKFVALRDELNRAVCLPVIAAYVGALYDYHHKLIFDLNRAFPLENRSQADERADPIVYWQTSLENFFPASAVDVEDPKSGKKKKKAEKDFTGAEGIVIRNNMRALVSTLYRHLTSIELAFPSLFQQVEKSAVEASFLRDTVLEQQGWKDHLIRRQPLSLEQLTSDLKTFRESLTPPQFHAPVPQPRSSSPTPGLSD